MCMVSCIHIFNIVVHAYLSGKVYTFGRKEYGRLGMGEDVQEIKVPTLVKALEDKVCIHVTCGSSVTFAVTDDGMIITLYYSCIVLFA